VTIEDKIAEPGRPQLTRLRIGAVRVSDGTGEIEIKLGASDAAQWSPAQRAAKSTFL
jgi:hypothetical protein